MSPEPLQPGTYTFQTLSGLADASNAGVTPFSMQFTISNPAAGQIALTTHGTEFVPGATPLPMTQEASGFLTALGVGTFASTNDPNFWYLNAGARRSPHGARGSAETRATPFIRNSTSTMYPALTSPT